MKKVFVSCVALIVFLLATTTTAFAHGGHHGRGQNQTRHQLGYAPCTVAGCDIVNSHQHNENWHCGQAGLDGQYTICAISDCVSIGLHEHDGEYYHCQNYSTSTTRRSGGGCHSR